ncbi:MAG: ATP-dependent sacrificial sulfur transferase LarE [Dissulfurispiraceae bacterium]|jgi:uncharacterized protein|nr:ATP-dependent sacrificial sulfur transferase LarE [Dissulfurispiraceae bacterium]
MNDKYKLLREIISSSGTAVIALSGGVDSSLVIQAAKDAGISFIAVTSRSEITDPDDIDSAAALASVLGINHQTIAMDMLSHPAFTDNNRDRCYICKKELFQKLRLIADAEGYTNIFDGSNSDDINDWRPGMKAAAEYNVRSPLIEAGFSKQDVRKAAQELGLNCWQRPSAPCIATRFPYGEKITEKGLKMAKTAEAHIKSLGFREFRVRVSGSAAKIELREEDIHLAVEPGTRDAILQMFTSIGFDSITIDLEGFKSGKLNRQKS